MTEYTVRYDTNMHNNGTGPQKRKISLHDRDRNAERGRPDNQTKVTDTMNFRQWGPKYNHLTKDASDVCIYHSRH